MLFQIIAGRQVVDSVLEEGFLTQERLCPRIQSIDFAGIVTSRLLDLLDAERNLPSLDNLKLHTDPASLHPRTKSASVLLN